MNINSIIRIKIRLDFFSDKARRQLICRFFNFIAIFHSFSWLSLVLILGLTINFLLLPTQGYANDEIKFLISKTSVKKHCVGKIEVKSRYVFMIDEWLKIAKEKSKEKWRKSVIKRFGSVYNQWDDAINQKNKCTRIGFGNDKKGNIGTFVLCDISAEPCTKLFKN